MHHYDGQPNYLEFFPMKASQQRERKKEMRRYHMGEPVKMRAFLIDCEAIGREMMHRLNLVVRSSKHEMPGPLFSFFNKFAIVQ